ncbi:SMC5-SMC6 complex localization factor protein 1-like isoform X2 [Mizuhopecten yessoensis]|uniref:SMC5-SMC6 complex localization factor protein 1-like isoform X2 n=1 Tax=Mizuhopecten yessoensis TaxID=6573 RepID=UPI000B45DE6D|nr:SMC5-SMC6 complex localization factor protein 1-like isoform X2 [Mizuhopecten yessoensis]
MSTSLRTRQKGKRVFQLSGFADAERKEIGKLITALGGIDFDSESFRSNCTHIVCKKITRSEKFLGGCATAKWILHPNYIRESSKVGQWLDEKYYDWSQIGTSDTDNIPTDVKEASRRWRYHFEVFGTTAFAGWKTAVVVSGARKNSVYKRLLHSGGAEVYNLKLPITQPEKVTNTLTYVFANDKCAMHIAHLIEYGVLCLRPDYIGDYLIKDPPPDPLDYLVKVPEDSLFQDVSMNDSIRSIQTSDLDFSQAAPPSGRNSPEKRFLSLPSSASCSPVPVNVLLPLPTLFSNSQVKLVSDRVTRSSRKEVLSSVSEDVFIPNQPVQASNHNKRKFSEIVGVEDALQELKKLKVSMRRFLWKPVICVLSNSEEIDQQQFKCVPMEFTDSMTNIIHSCLEEESSSSDFLSHALDLITSMIASRKYPKTDTIQFMMVKLLQNAASENLAIKSYTALMRLLQVHPPTIPLFTKLYMKTLAFATKETEDSNQPWNFIQSVIQKIVETPEDDPKSPEFKYNVMLLKFLVALLEQNFKFCLQRYAENEICPKRLSTCMISQVLWPGTSQFSVNNKCRELLSFLSSCLSSELDLIQKTQVLPLLLSLISMAAECCRLTEKIASHVVRSLLTSKEERTIVFIHELSRNIDVSHTDEQLLGLILRSLQPAWLCLGVCLLLLNNMDDYLVLEGVPRDSMERISLHTIVNKYFFMLPKLQLVKGNSSIRANTPVSTLTKMTDLKENETNGFHVRENKVMKNASRANKRNTKGETSLHRACIKNDVINLRKLLKIPGVDINAKDNAGWTPLHEACNHGHIQCVKELLNFVPSKTVDTFFNTGENVCRKADLLLSNNDGVTPLHDAVINDRLDVCRLLLQHGGWALTQCRTTFT